MTRQPFATPSDLALLPTAGPRPQVPGGTSTDQYSTDQGTAAAEDAAPWPDPVPPYCYLGGPAGSGKTFAVKAWQEREPGLELCSTTGISAINLGGVTVHAALGYFDTRSLQESYTNGFLTARLGKLWRSGVRRLIVDEVSMMDGDQLTYIVRAIEEVNGRGYVLGKWEADDDTPPPSMGLTLVGDFLQLPVIKAPFAFESPEWPRFADHTKVLTEIRRQADPAFITMLRHARAGRAKEVVAYFAGKLSTETDDHFDGPTLFAKNDAVDRYNFIRLSRVTGRDLRFVSRREGKQRSEWGNPDKPPATWGIPQTLHLKVGALVMILANRRRILLDGSSGGFLYVNGDLGTVVDAAEGSCVVTLQRTGHDVNVHYVRREVLQPIDSARRKELRALGKDDCISDNGKFEVTGWIEYLPLRVAYAATVHKVQGLSLGKVQFSLRDAFCKTPGLVYVALSRCRTAEGLRLIGSEAALRERCNADPRLTAWL